MFRKSVVIGLFITLLGTSLLAPRRSEALVGLVISPPIVIAGLEFMYFPLTGVNLALAGGVTTSAGVIAFIEGSYQKRPWLRTLGIVAFYAGILLLDQDGSPGFAFQPLSRDQIQALDLPTEAGVTFNSEVEELNSIKDSISLEVLQGEHKSDQAGLEFSASLWNQYLANLSPDTVRVLGKIMSQKMAASPMSSVEAQ